MKQLQKILVFVLCLFLYGCGPIPRGEMPSHGSYTAPKILLSSELLDAGETMTIELKDLSPNFVNPLLIVSGKFGESIYHIDTNEPRFELLINESGHHSVKFAANGIQIVKTNFYVNAINPLQEMDAFLGPKTLLVDDDERSMLVTIPTDKFNNILEDGFPIEFTVKNSANEINTIARVIENGVGYFTQENSNRVGRILIGANAGKSFIKEQQVDIEPGTPKKINLKVVSHYGYADSRQAVHVQTDVVKDQAANVVADGTLVEIFVKDDSGSFSVYNGYTVSGVANVYLQNPACETTWKINAKSGSVISEPISLDFDSNIQEFSMVKKEDLLVVGPMVGVLDQFIAEGTKVMLKISEINKLDRTFTENSEGGFVKFKLEGKAYNSLQKWKVIVNGEEFPIDYINLKSGN